MPAGWHATGRANLPTSAHLVRRTLRNLFSVCLMWRVMGPSRSPAKQERKGGVRESEWHACIQLVQAVAAAMGPSRSPAGADQPRQVGAHPATRTQHWGHRQAPPHRCRCSDRLCDRAQQCNTQTLQKQHSETADAPERRCSFTAFCSSLAPRLDRRLYASTCAWGARRSPRKIMLCSRRRAAQCKMCCAQAPQRRSASSRRV